MELTQSLHRAATVHPEKPMTVCAGRARTFAEQMVVIGRVLGYLDRLYTRRTKGDGDRYRPVWLKSMRGDRKEAANWKVLDVVMLWSVSVAALAMAAWFVFFPSSPLS